MDDDLYHELTLKNYRNHFEQIIIIILDNAVKYSTDRKEVHLSISSDRQTFEIAIQDFGEGISKDDLDKFSIDFIEWIRREQEAKGGNGLGLSIAKQLLESYKGRITAESVIGQGTIFRIYIPVVQSSKDVLK